MRRPLEDQRRFVQTSNVVSLIAPVGGWNTSTSLATMPPLDAIIMDNFMPEEDGVKLRGGDEVFASGMPGAVETLSCYDSPTSERLLAASGANIYDVTTGTAIAIGTNFASARWQTQNYNGHIFFANGIDTMQDYNGSLLTGSTFTGVDLTKVINVSVVRNRVWLVEKGSSTAYYGPLNSVSGAVTSFEVGDVSYGGSLVAVASWSRDAGDGLDDFTVFVMSNGRCLVYSGDPATSFTLVGNYKAPDPIGFRCTANLGGELIVLTSGGYFTMNDIMLGQLRDQDALSGKIREGVREAFNQGGHLDGWAVHVTGNNRNVIVITPTTPTTSYQHVFNTITNAWGRWIDRNIFSIASYNGGIYGGFVNGLVAQLEVGKTDDSRGETWGDINLTWGDWSTPWGQGDGANIKGRCVQAFNSFEQQGPTTGTINKRVTRIEPFLNGSGLIRCSFAVFSDYTIKDVQSNLNTLNIGALTWGDIDVPWGDWSTPWGQGLGDVTHTKLSVSATGNTFSTVIDADTNQSILWFSTNLTVKAGGIR